MSIQGSGEHPASPAQGRVWASKDEINQSGASDVSTFVSRSAGVYICCAKFCDAPMKILLTLLNVPINDHSATR